MTSATDLCDLRLAMKSKRRFQKGISCRGKYRLFGLPPLDVTFRGHRDQLQRSPKSAAEVFIALSLVWDFQRGIICRGKYVLFGLVWRSPKSAAEVTIVMS